MKETTMLETIHEDLIGLKKEIHELKITLIQEPELAEDVVERINEARQMMAADSFVTHEEMKKEFLLWR